MWPASQAAPVKSNHVYGSGANFPRCREWQVLFCIQLDPKVRAKFPLGLGVTRRAGDTDEIRLTLL